MSEEMIALGFLVFITRGEPASYFRSCSQLLHSAALEKILLRGYACLQPLSMLSAGGRNAFFALTGILLMVMWLACGLSPGNHSLRNIHLRRLAGAAAGVEIQVRL